MRCFGDVFEKTSTSMFLTMFFKTPNIVPTMHLTMLIAHPYLAVLTNHLSCAINFLCISVKDFPLKLNLAVELSRRDIVEIICLRQTFLVSVKEPHKSCVSSWWRRSAAQYWAPATFSCISETNILYFLYFCRGEYLYLSRHILWLDYFFVFVQLYSNQVFRAEILVRSS